MKDKPKRRSLSANARFHAMLSEWASKSGQDSLTLKRRIKDSMGAFTDVPVPNDPLTDRLLEMFARVLLALGHADLMLVLPSTRCVRLYWTSAKFTPEQMNLAMMTLDTMAADEGITLGPADNWQGER